MKPRTDLFHQQVLTLDGYTVIADYTGAWTDFKVYDPSGTCFGGTNCGAGWKGICMSIIRQHKKRYGQ